MFLSDLREEETINTCHKSFTNWAATVNSQSDALASTHHHHHPKEVENLIYEPNGEKEKYWEERALVFLVLAGKIKVRGLRQVKSHLFLSGPRSVYLEKASD